MAMQTTGVARQMIQAHPRGAGLDETALLTCLRACDACGQTSRRKAQA
jgi:hypothetical protein